MLAAALVRGRDVAYPLTRARLYWSESRLREEQGQSDVAARYAQRTLEILRTSEDNYAIALVLQSLAHIYLDLDRAEEALALLREGEGLINAAGTPLEVAQYRIEEARALAARGAGDCSCARNAGTWRAQGHPSGRRRAPICAPRRDLRRPWRERSGS